MSKKIVDELKERANDLMHRNVKQKDELMEYLFLYAAIIFGTLTVYLEILQYRNLTEIKQTFYYNYDSKNT